MFRKIMGLAALAAASVGTAQASWEARGNGLVYDTVLDITILTDFNYAQTSGYDADGRMNFSGSTSWADQLTYSSISATFSPRPTCRLMPFRMLTLPASLSSLR